MIDAFRVSKEYNIWQYGQVEAVLYFLRLYVDAQQM